MREEKQMEFLSFSGDVCRKQNSDSSEKRKKFVSNVNERFKAF